MGDGDNAIAIHRRRVTRGLTAAALRYEGLTFDQIGAEFGVTGSRAQTMVRAGENVLHYGFVALNDSMEILALIHHKFANPSNL